jgi:fructan beta-fructosidase
MRSLTAPFELELKFDPGVVERVFGIRLYTDNTHWTEIGFDRNTSQFYMDRTKASATAIATNFPAKTVAPIVASRPYHIRLVIDRSSIEAYAQGGTIAMTNLIFPTSPTTRVAPFSSTGNPVPVTGKIWNLHSIWQ